MPHIGWYGMAVGGILLLKLMLSLKPRQAPEKSNRAAVAHSIHAVITIWNEDPEMLRRCLESVLQQTCRPKSVSLIDDCSRPDSAYEVDRVVRSMERRFSEADIRLYFTRFDENRGKRQGLATGFRDMWDAEIYLCIDSDTVLDRHAVAEAAHHFTKRRVHAVTGLVLAANRSKNLLTRLIDMRYQNAFLGERVAYSRFGSVLCACGSLALYRGSTVRKYLDDFLNQRFLGKLATFGDDRRLTYYCLIEGKSLIAPSAVAWTDVPESMRHFLKQQTRWTKSFIREGVLLLFKFRLSRVYWWINLVELTTWCAFTAALLVAVTVLAVNTHAAVILLWYAVYVSGAAWLRSLHYLRSAGSVPFLDRVGTFVLAPLYALMNLALLIPLRLWALCTLRDTKWGTREPGAQINRPRATLPSVEDTIPLKVLYDPSATVTTRLPLPETGLRHRD